MPYHRRCGEAVDPLPWRSTLGETLYWCPQCAGHVHELEIWQEPVEEAEDLETLQG